ncbi:hypothetical protein I553_6221 [Mycobacterium xenopi 4042]|uniref:Transmembrane protein n=1 Tax=Mycobacterium xenopi 4042 TaxID=1299334 RepID=X8BFY4_MYCXE|nr:hypothetical protein I553_6221 [Mycobacterium xenopi 4042]
MTNGGSCRIAHRWGSGAQSQKGATHESAFRRRRGGHPRGAPSGNSGGAPIAFEELMDVRFALTATEIKRAERLAKFERRRRVWIRFLIVAVLILAALNLLLCMAYVFIGLVLHEAPF